MVDIKMVLGKEDGIIDAYFASYLALSSSNSINPGSIVSRNQVLVAQRCGFP